MPFRLRIPRSLYDQMADHALSALPNECCGLIAGNVRAGGVSPLIVGTEILGMPTVLAVRIFPLVNEANSPVEYLSEPRSMFEAVRTMRTLDLEILAVY